MSFIISNIPASWPFQKVKGFVFYGIPALFGQKDLFQIVPNGRQVIADR
jgi:hypothetical protein